MAAEFEALPADPTSHVTVVTAIRPRLIDCHVRENEETVMSGINRPGSGSRDHVLLLKI
jgi:hypothetical protein